MYVMHVLPVCQPSKENQMPSMYVLMGTTRKKIKCHAPNFLALN